MRPGPDAAKSRGLRGAGRSLTGLRRRAVKTLALLSSCLFAACLCGSGGAEAQSIRQDFYITNGSVSAAALSGNTLYIAGSFTEVGPATGGFVPIDTASALPVNGSPKVAGTVYAKVPDGSNGWYIGGSFTGVGGIPRRNLAHILADNS